MKETPKTQTWRTDGAALKHYLKSLREWSFVSRPVFEAWACCQHGKPATMSSPVYDDQISDYVTNCIAYAKRHKWIRCRTDRPRMWQVLPIA